MIEYPSIPNYKKIEGVENIYAFAFNKLDGNNIRFGYSKKKGFHKYGTRTQLIDENNEDYGRSIALFNQKYMEPLENIFRTHKAFRNKEKITVFCELHGENSFAGKHDENDDLTVTLFDVYIEDDEEFVKPADFIRWFEHLGIPDYFQVEFDDELIEEIKEDENLKEGMIFKVVINGKVIMWKIKTNKWLERAKNEGVTDLE